MSKETNTARQSWIGRLKCWWWDNLDIETDDEKTAWWLGLGIIVFIILLNPGSGLLFSWGTAFAYEKPGFKWFPVTGTVLAIVVMLFLGMDGLIQLDSIESDVPSEFP